jgi:hypothetical protein
MGQVREPVALYGLPGIIPWPTHKLVGNPSSNTANDKSQTVDHSLQSSLRFSFRRKEPQCNGLRCDASFHCNSSRYIENGKESPKTCAGYT